MEETDIIELLKRIKEGEAPKEIEIEGIKYFRNRDDEFMNVIELMYEHYDNPTDEPEWWLDDKYIKLDTKIKILDKPIIEELDENENVDIYELARKVNQIIKNINKEEK